MRLTFDALRVANTYRLPLFKNSKGELVYIQPDGSDWSLGDWVSATLGELGEAANFIKKVRRQDMTLDEAREAIAKELADTVIYLDILARRMDIDLGEAVAQKFNETSAKIDVNVFLPDGQETFAEWKARTAKTVEALKEGGLIEI